MRIKILLLVLSLVTCVFSIQAIHAKSPPPTQTSLQSVTLDMQNMNCAMCKITIKRALQDVEGVKKVHVDYDSKTTSIMFDAQKTNTGALIKATTNAGYPASICQPKVTEGSLCGIKN